MTRLVLALLVAAAAAFAPPGRAAGAPEIAALSPDDRAALNRAVRYLNDISTLRARFVQISSNGAYAEGEVLVERPGKMRFDYDPPHPALIIANGLSLLFYDRELKQASFLPLWETPLWFLIREEVRLSESMEVLRVEQDHATLRVTQRDRDTPDAGSVTLVFSDRPLSLRKWKIVDAQGIATEVSLLDPQFGVPIDPEAFDYKDLEIHTGPRSRGR